MSYYVKKSEGYAMRGKNGDVMACIDVGSGYLRMVVAQWDNGRLKPLDVLRKPLWLGRDVYATGRVGVETLAQACEILEGFVTAARGYGVRQPIAKATSAIREAANRDMVLDRIRLATTLDVQVLSNAEERLYDMLALPAAVPGYAEMRKAGVLVADLGYGGIQLSYIDKDEIRYSRHERLGALRLWDMVLRARGKGRRTFQMLDEHIRANTGHLKDVRWKDFQNGVALFGDADWLLRMCGATGRVLTLESVDKAWKKLHDTSFEDMLRAYDIPEASGEIVLPALMLLYTVFHMASLKEMHVPQVSLCEGVLTHSFDPESGFGAEARDILSYARHQRESYNAEEKHSEALREYAVTLFTGFQRLHGLSRRDLLLLELACILHEVGKYVASYEQSEQSARIVEASPPLGLSDEEVAIVSMLCRKQSPESEPSINVAGLTRARALDAIKLLVILRLADSLDASHKQKVKRLKVDINESTLIVRCEVEQDFLLEQQAFELRRQLLMEAFGLTPELRVKRVNPE